MHTENTDVDIPVWQANEIPVIVRVQGKDNRFSAYYNNATKDLCWRAIADGYNGLVGSGGRYGARVTPDCLSSLVGEAMTKEGLKYPGMFQGHGAILFTAQQATHNQPPAVTIFYSTLPGIWI